MKISPAKEIDLAKIEMLFHLPELSSVKGEYLSVDELSNYLDEKYFLVAEDKGKIIGAIFGESLRGDGVILWMFAVSKLERGQGTGKNMMKQFEKNAMKDKKSWIILYAPADKDKTLNFYEARSFSKGKPHFEFLKELGGKVK